MWRSISLRNRLNLIFASLFALWLVADAIHDVWQASGRSRVETQSAMRLTKDFVATTLALSPEAPEPEMVKNLVASLQHLRHVRAGIGDPSLASAILSEANTESEAPRWFRALVWRASRNGRHSGCAEERRVGVHHSGRGSSGRDRRGLGRSAGECARGRTDGARRNRCDQPSGRARGQAPRGRRSDALEARSRRLFRSRGRRRTSRDPQPQREDQLSRQALSTD